jgi:hypothetical protein
MTFFKTKRQNLHIHHISESITLITSLLKDDKYDHKLLSWVWIMYNELKHKPHNCISFHSVHNINYFHFTMEQQRSEGSKSYPESSTSKSLNTISVLFYRLQWQERGKVKSTLCVHRNMQQPISTFNYATKKLFGYEKLSHDWELWCSWKVPMVFLYSSTNILRSCINESALAV